VTVPAGCDPPLLCWSPFLLWGGKEVVGSMAGLLQGAGRLSQLSQHSRKVTARPARCPRPSADLAPHPQSLGHSQLSDPPAHLHHNPMQITQINSDGLQK